MPMAGPEQPPTDTRLTLTTLGAWSLSYAQPEEALAPARSGPAPAPGPAEEALPPPLLGPGKPLALIVYLACAPARTVRREHLIDLLWADLEPDAAAHAMRQTIWLIRHRLGHDTVKVAADSVRLACEMETDRDAFLGAVGARRLEEAVEFYHGDFLPSFAAPGGAEFEKWADLERDRLRSLFVQACHELARRLLGAGHPREALELARRARDADPDLEASWRLVLEASVSAGDPVAATLEADQLERLLAAESRQPEGATRSALRAARRAPEPEGAEQGAGPAALAAELVGREKEFKAILSTWAATQRSAGRHLHITGGPGLGKTRLLRDVLARLRATGARALYVRANPGTRHVAYSFASDVATQLAVVPGAVSISPATAATLVALNPALASRFSAAPERADGDEALRRRTSALVELLVAATLEGPVALLLDDAHWMDPASRQLVHGLLPKAEELPVLIITATRPGAAQELAASSASPLMLTPLGDVETTALLASLGDIPAERWWEGFTAALQLSCRGVPLLILEMLQLAMESGLLAREDGIWCTSDGTALARLVRQGGPLRHRVDQLSRPQRWLLLLLSVAGEPLDVPALAAASGRRAEEVEDDLTGLEQRGLLARMGDEWEPVHDEVAQLALELAAPEALHAAHTVLGRLALKEAERDPQMLVRAGEHLAAAGMETELTAVARRWVKHRRRMGDRRSLTRITADLVAEGDSERRARLVVRRLPMSWRISGGRPARLAATAGLVGLGAVAAAAFLYGPNATPDAVIVGLIPVTGDSVRTVAAGVRLGALAAAPVVDFGALPRVHLSLPAAMPAPMGQPALRPGGDSWVYTRISRDTGGMDVYTVGPGGRERRLTATRGDDGNPVWSPDGSRITFSTDRWSRRSHSAIAVMDADGRHVRRLTSGDARNMDPVWSPDGTRIAFMRRYYTRPGDDVCWVTTDGGLTQCLAVPGLTAVVGWRDAGRVVVSATDSAGTTWQDLVDLEAGQVTPLVRGDLTTMTTDGLWMLLRTDTPGSLPRYRLIPLDRPDLARPVVADSIAGAGVLAVVSAASANRGYLDSLAIVSPATHQIPLEGTYRLVTRGVDARGQSLTPGVVTWASSDTAVATVDSMGTVHPRRAGRVTIAASAGGWRRATTQLELVASPDVTVFREAWAEPLDSDWVPYGEPRPELVKGPGGVAAFWHHGDSSFASGVYSRRGFAPPRGLGLEVRVSTPISRTTWQSLRADFVAVNDSATLASWDRRAGWLPSGTLNDSRECAVTVPAGEGTALLNSMGLSVAGANSTIRVDRSLRSGRWWTLRIQIFPDGRCGVAINGRPVWRSRTAIQLDRPMHLFIDGYSYHTRILAGPLQVWTGVRRDIDWDKGPARPARAPSPARPPRRATPSKARTSGRG
jgi:DNA-binding SARP family transcriptional activator